ncbi:hypothetical protein N7509_010744 [Penicillium cosmopolitanum]|uniref:Uncharacterized protein n=1 Tax=Penicillium cosmopolitanum TaxID=1131564 RepID=A0A9X0B4V4_9EURO|nr:uncharacterized protein N7509_010744 [Penicillium cosmopolitanum]KAJ5388203.1 hypothetical protein N7509_010744 [Penicillium cosmopolitanum]
MFSWVSTKNGILTNKDAVAHVSPFDYEKGLQMENTYEYLGRTKFVNDKIQVLMSQFGQKYNIVLDSCQMVTCKVAEAIIRGVKGKEAGTSEEAAYEREAFQENLRIQTQMAVLGMSALGI